MSRGTECSHAAAVPLQRRGQASRQGPPLSGHDQHQRLRSIQGNAPSSSDHNQLRPFKPVGPREQRSFLTVRAASWQPNRSLRREWDRPLCEAVRNYSSDPRTSSVIGILSTAYVPPCLNNSLPHGRLIRFGPVQCFGDHFDSQYCGYCHNRRGTLWIVACSAHARP